MWILASKRPINKIQVGMLPRDCQKKKTSNTSYMSSSRPSTQYYYGNKYNELPSGEASRQVGADEQTYMFTFVASLHQLILL